MAHANESGDRRMDVDPNHLIRRVDIDLCKLLRVDETDIVDGSGDIEASGESDRRARLAWRHHRAERYTANAALYPEFKGYFRR